MGEKTKGKLHSITTVTNTIEQTRDVLTTLFGEIWKRKKKELIAEKIDQKGPRTAMKQVTRKLCNPQDMCLHSNIVWTHNSSQLLASKSNYPSRKAPNQYQNVCSVQWWILFSELVKIQLAGWAIKIKSKFDKTYSTSINWIFIDKLLSNCSYFTAMQ